MRLALLVSLALAALLTAQPPAGAGRYEDLVALFGEWREFQKPRVVDGVPDYTPAAMATQRARLPEFQRRLQAIDTRGWPVARQVDWHLVRAEMNGLEFDHRVLRPWARHPGFYAPIIPEQSDTPAKEGPAFAGALDLWRHSFPLPAAEVGPFRVKIRAIPRILDQARTNLVEDARDLWLVGIRRHKEQAAQRAARGLAGLKMHSNELSIEEAVRFASERTPYGWMKVDGDLVWGEQSVYLEQPGYGTSYLTGKAMIESLMGERARELGAGFSVQRFMDEVNAAGMIPVSMIRWELTGSREP